MSAEFSKPVDDDGATDEYLTRAPEPESAVPMLRECWRCGKFVDQENRACRFCRATLHSSGRFGYGSATAMDLDRPIRLLILFYTLLLVVSIIQACYLYLGPGLPDGPRHEQEMALLQQILVAEGFDTIFVIFAIYCTRPPAPVSASLPRRATS